MVYYGFSYLVFILFNINIIIFYINLLFVYIVSLFTNMIFSGRWTHISAIYLQYILTHAVV